MKEIYYKNDIVLKEKLPTGVIGFDFRYYVDRFNSKFATWTNGKTENCTVTDDEVTVTLHDHHLGIGELVVEKTYFFLTGNGTYKESTGVKIVGELSESTASSDGQIIDLDNVEVDDDGEYITIK